MDLTVHNLPVVTFNDATICSDDSHTLDAGTGFSNYSWSNGVNGVEASARTINVNTSDNYTVTVTDVNTCTDTATMFLTVNQIPDIYLPNDSICSGETYTIDAGTGFANYEWSTGLNGNEAAARYLDVSSEDDYWVTITNSDNCTNADTMHLKVNALPTVTMTGLDNTYNYQDPSVVITLNPIGGELTGNGITPNNSTFHPNLADTISANIITYTYTSPTTGCTKSTDQSVSVVTTEGRIDSLNTLYCYYDPAVRIYGYNSDTTAYPGNFTIAGGKGLQNFGNTAIITPSLIGPCTDTIIFTYTKGIVFEVRRIVTIDSVGVVDFINLNDKYCNGDPAINIAAVNLYPAGGSGVFSGGPTPGFIDNNNNTATLDPSTVIDYGAEYQIQYVYTSPNGCLSNIASKYVTVNDTPSVSFSLKSNFNIIENPTLLEGNFAPLGTFSGSGVSDNYFIPSNVGVQSGIDITYTYTNSITGCSNQVNHQTDVRSAETTIDNIESTYCYRDETFTITAIAGGTETYNGNGVFTSLKNGLTDNMDNTALYSLANTGAGVDTVTFSYKIDETDYYVKQLVAIDSINHVNFGPFESSYCKNNPTAIITFDIDHPNGSGDIVFSGQPTGFDYTAAAATLTPANADVGNYTVKMMYTSTYYNSGCKDSAIKTVDIYDYPDVDFELKAVYSEQELTDLVLQGTPEGGVFAGTGTTSNGEFSPPPGNYTISYTYTNETTGCSNSKSKDTEVLAATADFTGKDDDDIYCYTQENDTLIGSTSDGLPGRFYGDGITDIDETDGEAIFNPEAAGKGEHLITYAYPLSDLSDTIYLHKTYTVDSIGIVDIDELVSGINYYCSDREILTLNPINSGAPGNNQFFGPDDPDGFITTDNFAILYPSKIDDISQNINITYKYTSDLSNCSSSVTKTVFINRIPDVSFELTDIYNLNGNADTLNGTPLEGNFYGDHNGITPEGIFYPDRDGIGPSYTIGYIFEDENGCTNSVEHNTSVQVASGSISSLKTIYCYDDNKDTFTWEPDPNRLPGGEFIGDGITNLENDKAYFDPQNAGAGEHEIRFIYQKRGVNDTADFFISKRFTVDSIGNINFNGLYDNYCIDDAVSTLFGVPQNSSVRFTGNGIIDNLNGQAQFNPSTAGLGNTTITMTLTNSISGCSVTKDSTTQINDIPHFDFSIDNGCISNPIQFTMISETDLDSVLSVQWNFGDILSSTSAEINPHFTYHEYGTINVNLLATSIKGCTHTESKNIYLDSLPEIDFYWKNICNNGDSIEFSNLTTPNSGTTEYTWNFGDNNTYSGFQTNHLFASSGNYQVMLKAQTENGCTDSLLQQVSIRDYYTFENEISYFADINSDEQGWLLDVRNSDSTSWEYGIATDVVLNSETPVWVTGLNRN